MLLVSSIHFAWSLARFHRGCLLHLRKASEARPKGLRTRFSRRQLFERAHLCINRYMGIFSRFGISHLLSHLNRNDAQSFVSPFFRSLRRIPFSSMSEIGAMLARQDCYLRLCFRSSQRLYFFAEQPFILRITLSTAMMIWMSGNIWGRSTTRKRIIYINAQHRVGTFVLLCVHVHIILPLYSACTFRLRICYPWIWGDGGEGIFYLCFLDPVIMACLINLRTLLAASFFCIIPQVQSDSKRDGDLSAFNQYRLPILRSC